MACLFGHKWNGCKCERCGKTRDEQHNWNLCKGECKYCGKKQVEQHDWNGCKCFRCGKERDEQHDWHGCKCSRCGKTRDEQHDWSGCKCSCCGRLRDEQHNIINCHCSVCGKELHDWHNYKCTKCGEIDKNSLSKERIENITEQSILADIVKNVRERDLIVIAIKQLTDQSLLTDIAINHSDYYIRELVIKKITDQSILTYIVKNSDHCHYHIGKTIEELTDLSILSDIAMNGSDKGVRMKALSLIINQSVIAEIAKHIQDKPILQIVAEIETAMKGIISEEINKLPLKQLCSIALVHFICSEEAFVIHRQKIGDILEKLYQVDFNSRSEILRYNKCVICIDGDSGPIYGYGDDAFRMGGRPHEYRILIKQVSDDKIKAEVIREYP